MNITEFRRSLLHGIYSNVYQRLQNNYDYLRYSFDGVDRSREVNIAKHAVYLEFVLDNIEKFYAVYSLWKDDFSRGLYLRLLQYRTLGHLHIRIRDDMNWTTVNAFYERAKTYDAGASKIKFNGFLGPLRHHAHIPADGSEIKLDAWSVNVAYGLGMENHRQYYFCRDGVQIRPEAGDYVIDGGACFGDTAVFFASSVGPEGRVFAFDPLPVHVEIARFNVEQNNFGQRITVTQAGIGASSNHVAETAGELSKTASPGFSLAGRENMVPIVSIDDALMQAETGKVDFIKMDIEGFELGALHGAAETIRRHKPKLAISIYHKLEDFFAIPLYLKEQYPFYDFYLDHYTIFDEETVLYAVAR